MLSIFESDAPAVTADFGVPVVHGEESGMGIYEAPGTTLSLEGVGIATMDESVTLNTKSDFPTLAIDSAITVDGKNYIVRELSPADDGVFSKATLRNG